MYPNIAPKIEIRSTISHESRPEEVIGFIGRNKKLGRPAVVMKQSAIEGEKIVLPLKASTALIDENAELVVLDADEVLTMTADDFAAERDVAKMKGRGNPVTINLVNKNSDKFLTWNEKAVEVGI